MILEKLQMLRAQQAATAADLAQLIAENGAGPVKP